MAIFYAGNELDVFNPLSATCVESASIPASFDANYSRCAIVCGNVTESGGSTGFRSSNIGNRSAIWVSWWEYQDDTISVNYAATTNWFIANNSGQIILRCQNGGTNMNKQFAIWISGTTFTNLGSSIPFSPNTRTRFDVFIDFPNRIFRVWVAGVLTIDVQTPTGTEAYLSQNVTWNNLSDPNSGRKLVSEIIIADESTLNYRVMTIPATANGALTQWNGLVTDINELVLNDANNINTGLVDQFRTFVFNNPTIPSGFAIRALAIGARASSAAPAPQNIQGMLRIGTTNYFSANLPLTGALNGNSIVFDNNPATGVGFTASDINSSNLQFGLASRT